VGGGGFMRRKKEAGYRADPWECRVGKNHNGCGSNCTQKKGDKHFERVP